ncbi:hypothetical protein F4810DRAFT_574458 [Camillea tinctor]|nr:hypothetical protein F4810DRAFT_574458 [Camillea tinctor]
MEHPSRHLAQQSGLKQQIVALKQQYGLSRDELLALIEEDPEQESQSQPQLQPQQLQQAPPSRHDTIPESPGNIPNFSYRNINSSFTPSHQYRSSVSSSISSSSRESCFSSTSARSSISSTAGALETKFWCTSCDKTFKRKFDWKRHEEEFHERPRKYPCPNCNQSFWGSNTFNQHHKSAHGCRTCPHAESVVKHMPKRKAYGCGFCAALHWSFGKHINHVAAHFERGSTKADWLHSNVIYALLHQHGIHEAWKEYIAQKESQFNGHQPMFSWSPESTGRAQGFVENENPGQLQDLLEFFDGTPERAERILHLAKTCVHVVFKPKSMPLSAGFSQQSLPALSSNSHKNISVLPKTREPRRSASVSAISATSRINRARNRITSGSVESKITIPIHAPATALSPPPPPPTINNTYTSFLPTIPSQSAAYPTTYADKALPPAPLDPVSPMDIDFPLSGNAMQQSTGLLPALDLSDDWQSFTTTLVGDHSSMVPQGFPLSWDDLGQFSSATGGAGNS